MKNYIFLTLITVVFVLVSWFLINSYADSQKAAEGSLDLPVAEIKVANLDDFLLETPDVVLWFGNQEDEELIFEFVNFFKEENMVSEVVFLNVKELTESEKKYIEDNFVLNIEKLLKQMHFLVINDFEIIGKHTIENGEYDLYNLEIFLKQAGY